MRDVIKWEEEDLELVVKAYEKENVSIDYKQSEALNFNDKTPMSLPGEKKTLGQKHREDLIRDVAAMANSEGGRIIYGIKELKGGYPKCVDDGIDPNITHSDRIEQILTNNIHPPVESVVIRPIELKSKGLGTYAFVIQIPKATTNAPHQSDDKLYHKRYEATKQAMDDNQIRDAVRRSIEYGKKFGVAWELLIEVRRLIASATERGKYGSGEVVTRHRLSIAVSTGLRTMSGSIMSLPRHLRDPAARLVTAVDKYNSIVETVDPGQREEVALNEQMRGLLTAIEHLGEYLRSGLLEVLEQAPT